MTTYKVNWKSHWNHLAKFMCIAILIPVCFIVLIDFLKKGFSYEKIFEHLSPIGFVGIAIGICMFCYLFAGALSALSILSSIKLDKKNLAGRDMWGRKKTIPLSSIKSLSFFSNNGVNGYIVEGGKHGQVFIYQKTNHIDELLAAIEQYVPENETSNA